jgi:hypothetical protein
VKQKRVKNQKLLDFVKKQPCVACGWNGDRFRPIDPHHITTKGAGGGDTENNVIPLCRVCHQYWGAPFKGIKWMIEKYPTVRDWLERHKRTDVIEKSQR